MYVSNLGYLNIKSAFDSTFIAAFSLGGDEGSKVLEAFNAIHALGGERSLFESQILDWKMYH